MTRLASRTSTVFLAIVLLANDVAAQIPDTPVGLQFSAWLAAFNSGDREQIRRYLEANYPGVTADAQMNFYTRTGGFELRKVEEATPTTLIGLVQERSSDQFARFNLAIEPTEPHKVTRLTLGAIARPPEFPIARLSEAE